MKAYFLILLLGLSLEYIDQLSKYGSNTISSSDYLYLDVSSYGYGDNIYLEVSCYCSYKSNIEIKYTQLYDYLNYKNGYYSYKDYYSYSSSTKNNYYSYRYYYTYYYKIKLTSTYDNYLVFTTTSSYGCQDSFYVRHVSNTRYFSLYIFLGIMVSFIIIVVIIIYCVKKRPNYPNVIVDPLVTNNQTIYPPETEYIPPPSLPQQPYYQSTY